MTSSTPKLIISLTHANLKTTIDVSADLIYAIWLSEAQKCTMVLANGGAILPVSESPEAINKLRSESK